MAPSAHDLVLANGAIIDGSGAPAEPGDVAIDGDRIAATGPPGTLFGRRTIELGGKAVAPGFILVAPGKRADLVVFDPATVRDRATFDGPAVASAGIELVMVNGRATYRDGALTGERAGGMIRRQAA